MSTHSVKSYGVLLFPFFEVLDWAGPVEALNILSRMPEYRNDMEFSYIASTLDPVIPGPSDNPQDKFTSRQQYLPTHTFSTAPQLDVLIVPGGIGTFDVEGNRDAIEFIRKCYHGYGDYRPLHSIVSVCTGAAWLAQAGLLDGKRATTNKAAWDKTVSYGPKTDWVAKARWVQSGNVLTTSGVSAGTDGFLAWMNSGVYSGEVVQKVVDGMEWNWMKDPDDDPFAAVYGAKDMPPKEGRH